MKEDLPILSLDRNISFKNKNDLKGRSSLPDDILWGIPDEGFGVALKVPSAGSSAI